MTGKEAALAALALMGRVNESGAVDEEAQGRFVGLSTAYCNVLCVECAAAAGQAVPAAIASPDDTLPLDDGTARRVLPAGLAMYFAVADRDAPVYNFFSGLYFGALLPSVCAPETPITDTYGVLDDPTLRG